MFSKLAKDGIFLKYCTSMIDKLIFSYLSYFKVIAIEEGKLHDALIK